MSHVTYMNVSYYRCTRVCMREIGGWEGLSARWMSHVTHQWVMSHVWICHIIHVRGCVCVRGGLQVGLSVLSHRLGNSFVDVTGLIQICDIQRICLQAVAWEKLTMSCCRVIFVVVSAITPPWLASVVMNFKRGHEGALRASWRFDCANSNTVCLSCAYFNACCPVKTHLTQSCIMAPNTHTPSHTLHSRANARAHMHPHPHTCTCCAYVELQ